jgi:hypothetical protein
MIKAYEATKAPLYLMLGAGALNGARKKLEDYAVDFDAWADTSLGADVPLPA